MSLPRGWRFAVVQQLFWRREARRRGISLEPLSDAQMAHAVERSKREGWKEIKP